MRWKKCVFGACAQMLAEGFISKKNTFFSFLWEKVVKSKVLHLSFCSNIDSKSSNNLCFLFFFPFVMGADVKIQKNYYTRERHAKHLFTGQNTQHKWPHLIHLAWACLQDLNTSLLFNPLCFFSTHMSKCLKIKF